MKKARRRSDCPISFALDVFGDRWSLLIVRDLMFRGKSSYKEFLESEENMATNILADRLRLLESAGIVKKTPDKFDKRKDVYSLTAKGTDLLPVLIEIVLWSAKYDSQTAAPKEFVVRAKRDRAQLMRQIKMSLAQNSSYFTDY